MTEKLKMMSDDIIEENIDYIAGRFPNVLKETKDENGNLVKKIDFDVLKQELSNVVIDDRKERYQMTWPDKKKAILLANSKINGTLRPLKEKSVDFDNTQNVYIEGDNLDVLKLLRETYLGKIKMIYIDPPYNTGNDFVYEDDFAQSIDEYLKNSGQFDEQGNRLGVNTESNGRFHTDRLNSLYPRLKVARDLLADEGIIAVSIDKIELTNLDKIMSEIFTANNFIAIMPRKTSEIVRVLADYELQNINDYIVLYAKDINKVKLNKRITGKINYEYEDENGKYTLKSFQNSGENGTRTARPNLYYPIYFNPSTKILSLQKNSEQDIVILPNKVMNDDGRWLWSKEKFLADCDLLEYKNGKIYRKIYYSEDEDQNKYQAEKTWLDNYPNRLGANALKSLNLEGLFDYTKPVELMKFLINLVCKENEIIMDFYSGSGTIAQACYELNKDNPKKLKYILVQLPEDLDENLKKMPRSQTIKNAIKFCDKMNFEHYLTEISEERIRRAGKKIKEELIEKKNKAGLLSNEIIEPDLLDIGFRVFKLDSSNMNEVYYNPKATTQSLLESTVDNIKPDRTFLDLLFQVMLELGVELSSKINEKEINGKKYYLVNDNDIIACFDDKLDNDVLIEIAKL